MSADSSLALVLPALVGAASDLRRQVKETAALARPTPRRQFAAEWIVLLAALAIVGALAATAVWQSRLGIDSAERDRLLGQAHVVDENLGQHLAGIDHALATVRDEMLATPPARVGSALSPRLRSLSEAIPGVRSMVLLDVGGRVVAASVQALVGRDFSSRGYFQTMRSQPDAARLYVTEPYVTTLGIRTVVFARAVVAADGRLQGAALAALEPDYLEVLLRSVLYAPDMRVLLAHDKGTLFLQTPREPAVAESATRAEDAGGRADDRMTAVLHVAPSALNMDSHLVLVASRSRPEVFRPWRRQATEYAAFFLLLATAASLGLWRGQARRAAFARLEESTARERRRDAERLELALHGAALGLWDWDIRADRFDRNDVARLELGYAPDEIGTDLRDWRALIHPADMAHKQQVLGAHFRRENETYEVEYRVRHKSGRWVWLLSRAKVVERDESGAALRMVGTHMDLTARKRAEAALERSAQMLRRTGELGRIGGWELELATGELTWSEEVYRIHEVEPTVRPNLAMAIDFYAVEVRHRVDAAVREGVERGTPWDLELPFVSARGSERWVRMQGVACFEDGRPTRLIGAFQDITERKTTALELQRLNAQLTRLSTIDSLTEVGNRRLFDQTLAVEWQRASRRGEPVALLMIDIDHFKEYNDHYGHPAGDACLRRVASLIGDAMRRGGELVARYGGEEFAVLLPGLELDAACAAAERCREALAAAKIEHRALEDATWLSVSVGVASRTASVATAAQVLVDTADAALYRAKRCGRDRVES